MTAPDLDQLRARWNAQGRRLDQQLVLDIDAVRAALSGHAVSAFRRHARWLLLAMIAGALALAALTAFIASQWGDWPWVGIGASLLPLLIAEFVVDCRQWSALRRLDWNAPIVQLRTELYWLRARRLRLAKWILLLSVLLWLPFVLVLFKMPGVDLLRGLNVSVLWANLALGLAFIPFGLIVARWLTRRFGGSPGWQRFLDDIAGASWRRASDRFEARERFEAAVDAGDAEAQPEAMVLPPELVAPLRALRARILIGIVFCAALMLLLGGFNAAHGGELRFVASGLLLHLSVVAHLVVQIVHRNAVGKAEGGHIAMRERLDSMLVLRRRVATITVVVAPLLSLPLAIVLVHSLFAVDLVAEMPIALSSVFAVTAAVASVLIWRHLQRTGTEFFPRLLDAICLGTISRSRRIIRLLAA